MSKYHEREVLNAGKLGTYRVHSLFTRITSEGDLNPEGVDPFPGAVALHAHEYTHYLHNLTTIAGLDALSACFNLIVPFVKGTDDRGWFTAIENPIPDDYSTTFFKLMKIARGSTNGIPIDPQFQWPAITTWCFGEVRRETVTLKNPTSAETEEAQEESILVTVESIPVTAMHNKGEPLKFDLSPGLDFLSEGIAYEIEREQRRAPGLSDEWLDSMTPSYPYLAYRPLIEHLIGHKTTIQERIFIGNLALLTHHPSQTFFKICAAIKSDKDRSDGKKVEQDAYEKHIYNNFLKKLSNSENSYTNILKLILDGSGDHLEGLNIYCKLVDKGLQLRTKDFMLEQKMVEKKLDATDFLQLTLNMLDRLVCQEKINGDSTIEWIAQPNSVIAYISDREIQGLSVLQASIHYLQQHFTISGQLGSTAQLKESACPFDGACQTQKEHDQPENCRSKPWDVSVDNGNTVCWYEAGRLSLRMAKSDRAILDTPAA